MAVEAFKAVFGWLKSERKKPLLVHGGSQTGKKSIIRNALTKEGYFVRDPTPGDLKEHYDVGMRGKHAFIMRMDEGIGYEILPHVKKAPVVYVCIDPYNFGLTKAELSAKFTIVKFSTGWDYSEKIGNSFRDPTPTYWDAVNKIQAPVPLNHKIFYAQRAGDYFPNVVHNSYLQNVDIYGAAKTADLFSWVDANLESRGPEMFQLLDYALILKTIAPIKSAAITSRGLIIPKAKESNTFKPDPIMNYNTIFEKHTQTVVTPKEPQKPKKKAPKRKAKKEPKKAPKKTKRSDKPVLVFSL